jgi:FixJ family two-component response regulator
VALADRKAAVAELAVFRLDFSRWLDTLTQRDRRVIAGLCGGEPAKAVAGRLGLSTGMVSQLRRAYERSWAEFQGEAEAMAPA